MIWTRFVVMICLVLVSGVAHSNSGEGKSKLVESISERNFTDLTSLFEQASDADRLQAVRLMLPSANREISKAMLAWLEKQSFLVWGSEEATMTKMIWRETAILIAKGLGKDLEKTPHSRAEYVQFCADMRQRMLN